MSDITLWDRTEARAARDDAVRAVAAYFWARVRVTGGCWLWTGPKNPAGYGIVAIRVAGRQSTVGAHRAAFLLSRGPIPDGLQLDHLCRNTSCVNPDHLESVTPWVNTVRGRSVAAENAVKTHCHRGHEFVGANVRVVQRSSGVTERACRTCARSACERNRRKRGVPARMAA